MKSERLQSSYAFTLVELMISMSLLSILGLLVVQILQNTMQTWNYAESQRQLYENAWAITQKIQDDWESLCSIKDHTKEIRLLLDFDLQNRQRLRFVSRLEENKHSVLRNSGKDTWEKGYKDYYFTSQDAEKKLRASGGLAEIVYLQSFGEDSSELWRGFKTPIGGQDSFFIDQNIQTKDRLAQTSQLFSSDILYFGVECWGKNTRQWGEKEGNASLVWDSEKNDFPLKIQIVLSVSGKHCPMAMLAEEIQAKQESILMKSEINFPIPAESYKNFVRIGNEWISYRECTGSRLLGVKRGMLGTTPKTHSANTKMFWGVFFTTTLYLPTHYSSWKN